MAAIIFFFFLGGGEVDGCRKTRVELMDYFICMPALLASTNSGALRRGTKNFFLQSAYAITFQLITLKPFDIWISKLYQDNSSINLPTSQMCCHDLGHCQQITVK